MISHQQPRPEPADRVHGKQPEQQCAVGHDRPFQRDQNRGVDDGGDDADRNVFVEDGDLFRRKITRWGVGAIVFHGRRRRDQGGCSGSDTRLLVATM